MCLPLGARIPVLLVYFVVSFCYCLSWVVFLRRVVVVLVICNGVGTTIIVLSNVGVIIIGVVVT